MTTDIAQFLASQNRLHCDRLNAELTLEQCDRNRRRKGDMAILSCIGCKGIDGKATDMAPHAIRHKAPKPAKFELCRSCKRPGIKLHARGLCHTCYRYEQHRASIFIPEVKPPVVDSTAAYMVGIIDAAIQECRSKLVDKINAAQDPITMFEQTVEGITYLAVL